MKKAVLLLLSMLVHSATHAEFMGADNSTYLTMEESRIYSNAGRIECHLPQGIYDTTGWITSSNNTVVTVAHSFINPVTKEDIEISRCFFVLYDQSGNSLDRIAFTKVKSRWVESPSRRRDASHDLALAKLARSPTMQVYWPPIVDGRGATTLDVTLVGFYRGNNSAILRKAHGRFYAFPKGSEKALPDRASNTKALFVGSYDSIGSSSGAMVIEKESKSVVGLHAGYGGYHHRSGRNFDPKTHFNYGVLFDDEFAEDLKRFSRE